MTTDNQKESIEAFENKAIYGKPYLDIDRVITEGRNGLKQYMNQAHHDTGDRNN